MTEYSLTWISDQLTFIRCFFLLVNTNWKHRPLHFSSEKALRLCFLFMVARPTLAVLHLIVKDNLKIINSYGKNHAWSSYDRNFFVASMLSCYIWKAALRDAFSADHRDYNALFLTQLHNWWDPYPFYFCNLTFKKLFWRWGIG